jgi:hypothetical protein
VLGRGYSGSVHHHVQGHQLSLFIRFLSLSFFSLAGSVSLCLLLSGNRSELRIYNVNRQLVRYVERFEILPTPGPLPGSRSCYLNGEFFSILVYDIFIGVC